MTLISFEIPDDLLTALNESREDLSAEARLLTALDLFRRHRLSLGKAAVMAGLDRTAFMAEASRKGIAIADYDPAELDRELGAR